MESDCTLDALTASLKEIRDTKESVLSAVRNYLKTDGTENFIEKGIGQMFKLAVSYRKAFDRLEVTSKEKFDRIVKEHFRHHEIQELEEEIHSYEREWDDFLLDIDKTLVTVGKPSLVVRDLAPVDLDLIDARTDMLITEQNATIVVVSFGVREGALKWLEDTKCPYPMLLDQKRQLYASFGLRRSVHKVWSVSCMVFYAEKMAQGVSLIKPYDNVHDDPQQMGGDFIIDSKGVMQYMYCSQFSSDRPPVAELVEKLKKLNEKTCRL